MCLVHIYAIMKRHLTIKVVIVAQRKKANLNTLLPHLYVYKICHEYYHT